MKGSLTKEVMDAFFETLPLEFSVIDAQDNVLAWNRHDTRIFKRPESTVGRNVRNCHPRKSLDKVETILREMKAGTRDTARFWIDLPIGPGGEKQKVLIEYFALRTPEGKYVGCLEASQNISGLQALEGEKRLLD